MTNIIANTLLLLLFPIVLILRGTFLIIGLIIVNLFDLVPRIDKGDAWIVNSKLYNWLFN